MIEETMRNYVPEYICPLIGEFSRRCNVKLIGIGETREDGFPETSYIFNDNLGGYTLKAMVDSLEKSYELN